MDKKALIVLLLIVSCFVTAALHVQLDPNKSIKLKSVAQIDSLITQTRYDFRIGSDQVSSRSIQIDSVFSRKIYTFYVPPGFSKTTFHHHLRNRLYPLKVQTYGLVQLPEHNMDLHIIYNQTIHRTVQLRTDSDLQGRDLIIPRMPDI